MSEDNGVKKPFYPEGTQPMVAIAPAPVAATTNGKPQNLAYEDFAKLDIRAGIILTVEAVPKSKKLLKLSVDFAEESGPRVILAGIAEAFADINSAIGLPIVAILNLAPRSMMGIESHGMLLAGRNGNGNLVLVNPGGIVPGGEVG